MTQQRFAYGRKFYGIRATRPEDWPEVDIIQGVADGGSGELLMIEFGALANSEVDNAA